jgi:hypothetical protein
LCDALCPARLNRVITAALRREVKFQIRLSSVDNVGKGRVISATLAQPRRLHSLLGNLHGYLTLDYQCQRQGGISTAYSLRLARPSWGVLARQILHFLSSRRSAVVGAGPVVVADLRLACLGAVVKEFNESIS